MYYKLILFFAIIRLFAFAIEQGYGFWFILISSTIYFLISIINNTEYIDNIREKTLKSNNAPHLSPSNPKSNNDTKIITPPSSPIKIISINENTFYCLNHYCQKYTHENNGKQSITSFIGLFPPYPYYHSGDISNKIYIPNLAQKTIREIEDLDFLINIINKQTKIIIFLNSINEQRIDDVQIEYLTNYIHSKKILSIGITYIPIFYSKWNTGEHNLQNIKQLFDLTLIYNSNLLLVNDDNITWGNVHEKLYDKISQILNKITSCIMNNIYCGYDISTIDIDKINILKEIHLSFETQIEDKAIDILNKLSDILSSDIEQNISHKPDSSVLNINDINLFQSFQQFTKKKIIEIENINNIFHK